MENKYIQNITAAIGSSALVQAFIPVPGSPGNYEVVYVPKEVVGLPYKLFSANLTQVNTSAPTINVLYNDTGITFTGVYDDIGSYKLVADNPPTDDTKVQVFCGYGTGLLNSMRWRGGEVLISVVNSSLNPVNGSLDNTPIQILIWP